MPRRLQQAGEEVHEEPLLNLTPLIDVVFVVLITFMILAPILDTDRVRLAESGGQENGHVAPSGAEPIAITVRQDNSIWVENKPIALAELAPWLERQKARHPKAIPKLIHDSRAAFGTYQAIKNTVEGCGFEELDVVLQPR